MKTNRQKRIIETNSSDAAKLNAAADLLFECHHFAAAMKLPNLAATAKTAHDAVVALLTALEQQQPHVPSTRGQTTLPGVGDAPEKPDTSTPEGIAAWAASQAASKKAEDAAERETMEGTPGGMNETQDLPEADKASYEAYEQGMGDAAEEARATTGPDRSLPGMEPEPKGKKGKAAK